MRVLVTGVGGFLGSHLADALIVEGHDVYGVDDFSTGTADNVPADVREVLMADLSNHEGLGTLTKFMHLVDVVYHCAAAAYEGVSVFSPAFVSNNIYMGSANVFTAAASSTVERIIFCSSMARYGIGDPPFYEVQRPEPVDPYGVSKLAAEKLLKVICEAHHMDWVVAVPHNIYGPRQKYDDPYRNVLAIMANRMLQGKPPIIYGDGTQVRCFSFVTDVIPSLLAMATDPKTNGQVINVGPDKGEITINEAAEILANVTGLNTPPIYMPGRPREVKHAVCSANKLRNILGFEQKIELSVGIKELVRYIKDNGPKPFNYHLNLEIKNSETPKTWAERLM